MDCITFSLQCRENAFAALKLEIPLNIYMSSSFLTACIKNVCIDFYKKIYFKNPLVSL